MTPYRVQARPMVPEVFMAAATAPQPRIGEMLIQEGYITKAQLQEACRLQQATPDLPIGQALCRLNFLKQEDLDYILTFKGMRKKLGELLINDGLLDQQRLGRALEVAGKNKIPLGQALIRMRLLSEEQVAQAVAKQYDLPFMSLLNSRTDSDLGRFVSSQYAVKHRLAPVRFENGTLTIAVAFPPHLTELEHLKATGGRIELVIAPESQIAQVQQKLYRGAGGVAFDDDLALSEDSGERQTERSRYTQDVITADVERLTKMVLSTGIKNKASDIHLESTVQGLAVRYRIDGMLQNLDLGAAQVSLNGNARQVVSRFKILCDMDIAERRRPQDSSFKLKVEKGDALRTVDFRVSTVPTQYGENVVIRILDKQSEVLTLPSLGYNRHYTDELVRALEKPTGMFLVTGPTGSGKSTALYAVLGYLNRPERKTLTVEDPIEYTIDGITQTEVNETIGNTFARMLRAFLRQNPDNIMVGEIRDAETATISVRAALTGHTVLTTLHTNDATSVVTRLVNMGLEPGLLATTLRGVLAQRLVRRVCPDCCGPAVHSELVRRELGDVVEEYGKALLSGEGCPRCNYSGFKGRLPIAELWLPDRDELLLIAQQAEALDLRTTAFGNGRRTTMLEDGLRLAREGLTTLDELIRVVPHEQFEAWRRFSPRPAMEAPASAGYSSTISATRS